MASPKPIKPKKCRCGCGRTFTPRSSTQVAYGWECALKIAEKARVKREQAEKKIERKAIKEAKEKLKTRRDWMKEAQIAWNSWVRARDYGKPCASCGATPSEKFGGTMDCSHYRSVGSSPHLRFNAFNAAAACVKCNRYLGGNIVNLRAGLIQRFGIDTVERIESDNSVRKFSVDYLKRIKSIFTRRARIAMARASKSIDAAYMSKLKELKKFAANGSEIETVV